MDDEARRCIREARARALARAGLSDPCAVQPPSPRTPSPTRHAAIGGASRCPPSPPQGPPTERLLNMSPEKPPDRQRLQDLQRVFQLSQCPVPQPRTPEPQPQVPQWDYGDLGGPGYEDPEKWKEVQDFDPFMPAQGQEPAPGTSACYFNMLSNIPEPEIDISGTVEDILGRAHHKARLVAGERKNVSLYPEPYSTCMAAEEPSLDQILAGAPQLDCGPPTGAGDETMENEDDYDLQLLPPSALDLEDDFAVQCTQQITTDAFGLPFRRYPHAEKAKQEKLTRERAEAMRREQEQARMQAEEHQRAAQLAAEEAANREARARAEACAPPTRAGRAGVRSTSTSARTTSGQRTGTRTTSAPRAGPCGTTSAPRAGPSGTTSAPRAGPSGTTSAPRAGPSGAGSACPPPGRITPAQAAANERAAKVAAAAVATKARTKYQPPKLKCRPPPKPPTVAKAPRGLDKKPDRWGTDPTRDRMNCPDYDYNIEPEEMPFDDCPQPIPINVGPPVEMCGDSTNVLEEVKDIINEARGKLCDALKKYS